MAGIKYFDGIAAAQNAQLPLALIGLDPFDFNILREPSWFRRAALSIAQTALGPLYAISRAFVPLLPLAGLLHVTRDAQVREILLRPDDFQTPFGPEMAELGDGATFLLGLDGAEHDRLRKIMQQVIRREDGERIAALSTHFATALLENCAGRIDVVNDLLKRVPGEICLRYFGLKYDDVDALGDWTMAISAMLFGDPFGRPAVRRLAINGAQRLRFVIDDALGRTQQLYRRGQISPDGGDNLIERLVWLQQREPISDAEIRAILTGLATGFIPTNTLAATRMLQVLLDRDEAMTMARDAAQRDDLPAMRRIVYEAGRLNPALAPGQWRYCPRDTMLNVDGRDRLIKAGTSLLVSTMSAMRDKRVIREPKRFWPDRPGPEGEWQEPDLLFGIGSHSCMGKHLAIEQISALFMVLLKQPDLKPVAGKAGKMQAVGPFPRHLEMRFTTASATQSMFIVQARALRDFSKAQIDARLAALGNPADAGARAVFDSTGIVRFSSFATIEHDEGIELVWELSVDGTQAAAINVLVREGEPLLRPIFAMCGLADAGDLADFLCRHIVTLHGKPWGANGLNFNGTPEFSGAVVAKQARFANFVERVLTEYLGNEARRGSHAMLALTYVRRILDQDHIFARTGTPSQRALMQEAADEGFDAFQCQPAHASLALAKFSSPTKMGSFLAFLKSRDAWPIYTPVLLLLALFGRLFWEQQTSGDAAARLISVGLLALLATIASLGAAVFAFAFAFRRSEKRDWIDRGQAPLDHVAAIVNVEDTPGFAQSHILAVGVMKPGLLRTLVHAFALWAIRMIITYHYRPGFVINMGTIHYARWWRVPGTNRAAFYANFDGSWENYLEDFITRARWGQTAAWSNWQGFPETRYLMFKGAQQGDDFKRWVRSRQQQIPFWYSRYPSLTTEQIRANALIHSGVARVRSNSEAEEWLRCFGSMPRVENRIESDEVQAIMFSGMKRLPHSAMLIVALPKSPLLGEWLSWIRGETQSLDSADSPDEDAVTGGLMVGGVIVPVQSSDGSVAGYSLAHSLTLTFGDRPLVGDAASEGASPKPISLSDMARDPQLLGRADAKQAARRAIFLGLSASGIACFDAPNVVPGALLMGFPPPFRMGMARRARILGDIGGAAPQNWRWSDASAEAVLSIYAETPEDLDYVTEVHRALLENYGGRLLHQTACAPINAGRPDVEHFGYRDGISQPVIRGTGRTTKGVPARDILEPGEFILGYKNGEGFASPSPLVAAEADMGCCLPVLSDGEMGRYPDFGDRTANAAPRDFGRNGSYLVIRELAQDVDGFDAFVDRKAKELRGDVSSDGQMAYRNLYKLIGQFPDKDWVKAKLMGRWPDGRPMVGNPVKAADAPTSQHDEVPRSAAERENDFSFGSDDPQGYACPFGSHIRRTNPRDSKHPGDAKEQIITNRHRLLRRGRTYVRTNADGGEEKGLMFVSLCADIARQFEFVQQLWANAPSFHGLINEPDPIFGADTPDVTGGGTCPRQFTIPTPAGPIKLTGMQSFVEVKAGGYFFLPSRSALTWMTEVALRAPVSK